MVLLIHYAHGAQWAQCVEAQWEEENKVRRQLICPLESWSIVVGKEQIFLTKQEKAYEGSNRQEQNLLHMCRDMPGCSQDGVEVGEE